MTTARPNPETIAALLDTAWRLAGSEAARTDGLDRKAATLATFASLLASLTATLGTRLVQDSAAIWALGLFVSGLIALVVSVALAVVALVPREQLTLGATYIERLPMWPQIMRSPEEVRGEAMRGVVHAIARERTLNDRKARVVRQGFSALLIGLVLIAAEATTLAVRSVTV